MGNKLTDGFLNRTVELVDIVRGYLARNLSLPTGTGMDVIDRVPMLVAELRSITRDRDELRARVERMEKLAQRIADAAQHCKHCRDCGDGPCCDLCEVDAACEALEADRSKP